MIDLHLHSNKSDGKLSVKELAEKIVTSKIDYCSLTDHDTIDGLLETKKIMDAHSIGFINGVEFSVLYERQEIHLLIYDFDIKQMAVVLDERNRIVGRMRSEELAAAVDLFRKEGLIVSDNLTLIEKKPVGLLVALDIYNNEKNQELLLRKYGHLLNEKEFYDYYQAPGQHCYVPKSGVDLDWLTEKLRDIRCDKILAHPFVPISFLVKPLTLEKIDDLISKGVNGIEVYHAKSTNEQTDFLKKYVAEKKLLFTGGSNYHGKTDDTIIGFYADGHEIPAFKLTNFHF